MSRFLPPLVLFGALLVTSCTAKKKLASADDVRKKPTPEALVNFLDGQQIKADWLSTRARIFYEDEHQSVNATLYLRMREDSLIWLSFRKFNVEAVRVKITPDSVYVLNRLDKQYAILPISDLEKQYSLPTSFGNLQTLIKGGALLDAAQEVILDQKGDAYLLTQEGANLNTSVTIDSQNLRVQHLKIRSEDQLLNVDLKEYGPIDDQHNFSYLREVSIFSRALGQISCHLNFSKIELNIPKSIRFEIPA